MIELLEGKAREVFERWLMQTHKIKLNKEWRGVDAELFDDIQDYPESAQFGLIQEWADSEGYYLEIGVGVENKLVEFYADIYGKGHYRSGCFDTRKEAQQEAVKKLNEIINQ